MLKLVNKKGLLLLLSFLIGLSLLFKDQLSTIAIILFVITSFALNLLEGQKISYQFVFLIPSLLLVPRFIGLATGNEELALKELVRSLPFLILFISPFLFKLNPITQIDKLELYFLYGVLLGLLIFMVVCNFNVIYKMIANNEPLEYFFRWRHLNINFVKPIGTHPPYVGIIAIYALIRTLYNELFSKRLKGVIIVLLFFLLIQLLSRNALVVFMLIILYYSLVKLNIKAILLGLVLFSSLVILVISHPHPYLKKKLFDRFNFTEVNQFDKRLERLKPSYNVFKESPLLGVGPGIDNQLRKEQYKELEFVNAYKHNFNSHNQFAEYLVSHGILGLTIFISVLLFLWKSSKGLNNSNKLLVLAFVFSCLTESVLERSLGIKYFSLISFFILIRVSFKDKALSNK